MCRAYCHILSLFGRLCKFRLNAAFLCFFTFPFEDRPRFCYDTVFTVGSEAFAALGPIKNQALFISNY